MPRVSAVPDANSRFTLDPWRPCSGGLQPVLEAHKPQLLALLQLPFVGVIQTQSLLRQQSDLALRLPSPKEESHASCCSESLESGRHRPVPALL